MSDPAASRALAAPSTGIPAELAGFAIQAKTMDEAFKLCQWLAQSPLIPKAYQGNPAAIWTAGAMGQKLGVDLFTAMTGIASINGRPSVWGDLLRGLVLANPQLEALKEWTDGEGNKLAAFCTIKRKGFEAHTERFGVDDAEKAGLLNKDGPWKLYTRDMLVNRAFARAARRRFSDVLSGLSVAEEQEDVREVEATVVGTVPEATPAKERRVDAILAAAEPDPKPAAPAATTNVAEPTGATQQTIAGAEAAAPKAITQKDVNDAAVTLHRDFKSKATDALKAICKDLGVDKISACPAEKLGDCLKKIQDAHTKLAAEAKAGAA